MVELENICFSYGDGLVLDHINYEFQPGQSYTIEGPNGCGKSTLFRILLGLDFPDEGHYRFNRMEINRENMKSPDFQMAFHRQIGFVFQDPEVQLFCTTVEDEIMFGPAQLGLSKQDVLDRVDKYIEMFGLDGVRRRAPFNLSGGEKKRVALASVLAMDPKVLVLDEPMNGLDDRCQSFFRDYIRDAKGPDRIVICSTHDPEFYKEIGAVRVHINADHQIIKDKQSA